ncbi:MAG: hypothetical protein IJG62_02505 [Synergistaceae bacterium]|nr:hypothetical protein [Synergistaceae bacterium]MBQ3627263.1 hypothetical protein [Synergistaceae bacterium]MBQ6739744.1 hypothetical protein [Synergistaceae bacterium]MBQ7569300.1 hypothetical protein [Synergistaceae bacterium]MBQ9581868.1 hypothetical protein [Synergistaceae bacterium]
MLIDNSYKDLEIKPVSELMAESLDSAVLYSDKLKGGVRELMLEVEETRGKGVIVDGDKILPTVVAIMEGVEWLMKIYNKCQFFSSRPIFNDEDNLIKSKILSALQLLIDHIETDETDHILYDLRDELTPGLNMLDAKLKELAKFSNKRGVKSGILMQ